MKSLFDKVSFISSKTVTENYSTSFSLATSLLGKKIRQDIYNIYGFVRFADEIVDSFHNYNKKHLFDDFERQLYDAIEQKISLNPILNSFQHTFHKYNIDIEHVASFMKSMRVDLDKSNYLTKEEFEDYIYGSADVVGLMCLKVFVNGDQKKYLNLEHSAKQLGSAFQKVNFLRDLKQDYEDLNRSYFPNVNLDELNEGLKKEIIADIEENFQIALQGILKLPIESKFGVYTAFRYYKQLLLKIAKTPAVEIKSKRIRVANYKKIELLTRSYVKYQLNLI